jgi:CubicO group peptidase (beta-lactamase class C family)
MPTHQFDPDALDHAFAIAARRARSGELPFVILGVANAAGTIRLDAVTSPNAERRVGTNDVCLLASITKPIVATAALRLVEEGALSLSAPLADVLPELRTDNARRQLTAWHVLTHTTGIDDEGIESLVRAGMDRPGLVGRVLARQPAAVPGSRFAYMTIPFELLALAMERAAGDELPAILQRTVLDPLHMRATSFDPRAAGSGDRLPPLDITVWDGARLVAREAPAVAAELAERYTALRLAGGGLWSTAGDLLRFGRAMLRGGELDGERVLSPAFVELATREATIDGLGRAENRLDDDHYALGWGKPGPAHPASPAAFGHGGQSGTKLWVDPGHDLVVVYLSASWGMPGIVADEALFAVYAAIRPN